MLIKNTITFVKVINGAGSTANTVLWNDMFAEGANHLVICATDTKSSNLKVVSKRGGDREMDIKRDRENRK